MTFKDCLAADLHNTFLNPDEFAEYRTVAYDGETYEDIPVSIQDFEETDRPRITAPGGGQGGSDSAPGMYVATHTMYCAKHALDGEVPKQGKTLKISTDSGYMEEYWIASSGCEMGMLRIDLRAVRS